MNDRELLETILGKMESLDEVLNGLKKELKSEVGSLRTEMGGVKSEIGSLRTEMGGVKSEVGSLRTEMGGVKSEVGSLKREIGGVKSEAGYIKGDLTSLIDEVKSVKEEVRLIRIQQKEDHLILRALEHKADVNKAEHDQMNMDLAHIKGQLVSVNENIDAVKEIIGRHEVDITVLKRRPV